MMTPTRAFFEVEDQAADAVGKFDHFAGHAVGEAVAARDAVADFQDAADLAGRELSLEVFNFLLDELKRSRPL